MQLRNKYYPYPVLVEGGDYYENSKFSSNIDYCMDGYNIKLTIETELNNKKMLDMINDRVLSYAHHIECPQTCYRRAFSTFEPQAEILLRDSEVNGIVQVCTFIVANKDIEKYSNESFSPDFRGWKFNIDKGCVMAVGAQYNIRINKQRDDFANTSSIFSIVKNTDPTQTYMAVDMSQQKIVISLPETTYNQYSSVQNYYDVQPVMHSMIIIPTLIYVFSELQKAGDQLYLYEDNRWYRGLKKACKSLNIDLSEASLKNLDIMNVPQQLMDTPLIKAIAFCAMGGGTYED